MSSVQHFLDGAYRLETFPSEMRMSHWVYAPLLTETETGTAVLDLKDGLWDLRSAEESGAAIRLKMAYYPVGGTEYQIEIRPQAGVALVAGVSWLIEDLPEALAALVAEQA